MYTPEQIAIIKEIILDRISKGDSLKKILDTKQKVKLNKERTKIDAEGKTEKIKMPSRAIVYQWLNVAHEKYDKVFLNNYVRAREDSADLDVEKMEDIVEDIRKDELTPQQGTAMANILKWTAGKKKPKKYGDMLDVTSGGEPIEQVTVFLPDNGRPIKEVD